MSLDLIKPRGSFKSDQITAGGAVLRQVPYFGIVKDNIDPTRAGRIRVYLMDFSGADENDSKSWITVSYMSSFFGTTTNTASEAVTDYGDSKRNSNSYGMWTSAPDIGTVVICVFVNGDPNFGYYIGGVPSPDNLQMVPAIGAKISTLDNQKKVVLNEGEASKYGGATYLPVVNFNLKNPETYKSDFLNFPTPVHSYQASIYYAQGLLRDTIRGPITSSAQRETPSRVGWGVSTPGRPIYEGNISDQDIQVEGNKPENQSKLKVIARRGGHSIVMDDGNLSGKDQLIRLRTANGHQILMSDDGQCLFIIHSNGKSWIELGKEGTIDMYSTNSVNIRTNGDLNLHADRDVNINAKRNLNLKSEGETKLNSIDSITIRTDNQFINYSAGNYTLKTNGSMSFASKNDSSFYSDATTYINGSMIHLNTGSSSTVPAEPPMIPIIAHTDTLYNEDTGWLAAPASLYSITSRAPAHTPWAFMGLGVDSPVDLTAEGNLPSPPKSEVTKTNAEVSNTPITPTTPTLVSTVPSVKQTTNIDSSTIDGLASARATTIANGATSEAAKIGHTVTTNSDGKKELVVGALGLTPKQLVSSGIIKPGSEGVIEKMINSGVTDIDSIITPQMLTGKNGITEISKLSSDVVAQVETFTDSLSDARDSLLDAAMITGKEDLNNISGLVLSASVNGVKETADLVKNKLVNGSMVGAIKETIASGNFATGLNNNSSGPLGSINSSLSQMKNKMESFAKNSPVIKNLISMGESLKSSATNAYNSIASSLPKLKAGIPQDLGKINEENVARLTESAPKIPPVVIDNAEVNSASTGLNNIKGAINNLGSLVSKTVNNATDKLKELGVKLQTTSEGNPDIPKTLDDALKQKGLDNFLKNNIPPNISSELNSAVSSLSSGKTPIGLPIVSTDTDNFKGVFESSFKSLAGNVSLPPFAIDPSQIKTDKETLERRGKLADQINELRDKKIDFQKEIRDSVYNYEKAKAELPPNDPRIEQSYQIMQNKFKEDAQLDAKILELQKQF